MIAGSVKKKALDTIEKYHMINPGEKLVVAVSGGPDSIALLYLLYDLREELKYTLHMAHLDHKLRGEESKADAEYVLHHARKLQIPITLEIIDVHKHTRSKESTESGARRIRYDFYERVMTSVKADKVALGHNADDQAETVLMRLLRGSGMKGLSGIPPVRDRYIRPLIQISRGDIEKYLREIKVTPRQDSSNFSMDYKRNRIRHELIPLLEREYSPNIKRILQQTGEILRAEDDLLTAMAREELKKITLCDADKIIIQMSSLADYHIALQRRIIRIALEKLMGDLMRFDYDHIKDILELALHGGTGSVISLPREISAERSYHKLIIRRGTQPKGSMPNFEYIIKIPGETEIPELSLTIRTTKPEEIDSKFERLYPEDEFRAAMDYHKICGDLHLRNRRAGDRFMPLGMAGMKKLKDFFIDLKIPKSLRDSIPILTDDKNIIWVVGYRIDDRYKIVPETKTRITVMVIRK
jgi:tRNA(Ile)-lysidine synthase